MLNDIFAVAILFLCFALACLQAVRVCSRNQSLRRWLVVVLGSVFVWGAATTFNLLYWTADAHQYDGTSHELKARVFAARILRGDLGFDDLVAVGNEAYQLLLGVVYAFTSVNPWVIYGVNGLLAFCGLLYTLEAICRHFGTARCPLWLVILTMFLPSCLFWGPLNLKEGVILFGIGQVVRWFAKPSGNRRRISEGIGMAFGSSVVFLLRPHIAAAWIGGMTIGRLQPTKSPIKAVLAGLSFTFVGVAAIYAVEIAKPGFISQVDDQGLTGSMNASYQKRMHIGDTAIFRQDNPVPFVTGLMLVLFAPPPQFWGAPFWLLLGVESFCLTMMLGRSWFFLRVRWRVLLHNPFVVGAIYVILFLAFYLSYTYNMGLAMRQKIQVVPALLVLICAPVFESLNRGSRAADDESTVSH